MKRVVVTGIGAITPLGNSFHESWEAAKAGQSGIGPITRFDTSAIKWKVAGELKGFDAKKYLSQKEINRLDPFVQYAVAASIMAAEDAGLISLNSLLVSHQSNLISYVSNPPPLKKGSKGGFEKGRQKGINSARHAPHEYLTSGGVIIGSSRGGIRTIEQSIISSQHSSVKKHAFVSRITHHAYRLTSCHRQQSAWHHPMLPRNWG